MKLLSFILMVFPLSLMAQEYSTLIEFQAKLGDAGQFIEMKSINENENLLLKQVIAKDGFNTQYLLDDDIYFKTNTDAILNQSNAKTLIEARKSLFNKYPFSKKEGNFQFPYPLLTHWDLLPHPPIQSLDHELSYYTDRYLPGKNTNAELLNEKFNRELNEITQSDVTYGNTVKPVQNKQIFFEMQKMIHAAKDYVLISDMFITCDHSVMPLVDLMESKIKSGVPVYMITERVFALKYSKCLKTLKKKGVELFYSDYMIRLKSRLVLHTKFVVSDNDVAMVMGSNILDTEIESTGFNQKFRDTGTVFTGPIVTELAQEWIDLARLIKPRKAAKLLAGLEARIAVLKHEEKNKGLRGIDQHHKQSDLNGMCRVVMQAPHRSMTAMHDLYSALTKAAKSSVFINLVRLPINLDDPKEASNAKIFKGLYQHAKNDKDFHVDIFTNHKHYATGVKSVNYDPEAFLTKLYSLFVKMEDVIGVINSLRDYFGGAKKLPNFDIWDYFQFVHSKTLMIDNTISVVGSYNIDRVSDEESFEIAVACHDAKGMELTQKAVVLDLINSVPVLE